jgi:hypothetical protein
MVKRKHIPVSTENELFRLSGRKCCMCFAISADFGEKQGQRAHLDGNPENFKLDNRAWLCLPHHNLYDTKYRQTRNYTMSEVKMYRTLLYEAVEKWRESILLDRKLPLLADVPKLSFVYDLSPTPTFPEKGIQITDISLDDEDNHPLLYLSIYFKRSRFFGVVDEFEKWLYLEAHMRIAMSLRIQVRAWHQRDIDEFMSVLRGERSSWSLYGPRSGLNREFVGDQFQVWREESVNRLMLSTYTPTFAGVSIHARLTDRVMDKIIRYLDDVGFTEELSEEI